ncbi:LysE family translocator [Vibrio lentus]|uniref:LysE family translocator n=1 Tax=Vibrio TaxID=662 RepID=UPI0002DD7E21|nr:MULTISPECIES: LysE family translocator [Vibrio]OCH61190.1 MFS transporter [Vibrio lentus]PMG77972.1 MFS transporter [Vibrio lentus]PMI60016.1 MFS transporter [Vibrio lentus]PMI69465.1 MFS transporter [Vibrio lentus]PMI83445.1 MFS transporter [Vibrio lentus]
MDLNHILTFVAVATLLVISPGPNGVLIAKTVSASGRTAGFANIWGFVVAFYVHGTLSIFGISILLVKSSQAFFIFKMLGAAYLVWIGLKAIKSAFHKIQTHPKITVENNKVTSLRIAFTEGLITNVLNPKVSMFYLAAFPQFMPDTKSPISAYVLVTAHSMVNFIWFAIMVMVLSKVKNVTDSAKFKAWLNSITGLVFIAFGSKLALMKNG